MEHLEINNLSQDNSHRKKEKKRVRKYTPKVSTGCKTCKIRRVKCGEEKPSCKRCTSTGRTCDGYLDQPLVKQHGKSSSHEGHSPSCLTNYRPSVDIPGNDRERHSFHFFLTKTAGEIAGLFSSDFWERSVLQACHSEPTVKHALLALSAVHETFNRKGYQELASGSQDGDFALQQYTKAVGLLASEIATKREHSLQVTLMTCLIFVFLETLRDDNERAMQHLKSGLQILQNWRQSKRCADPRRVKCASQDVDESLLILYRRINISATIHGTQNDDFTSQYSIVEAQNTAVSQKTFDSLAMASREMDVQLAAISHHLRVQHEDDAQKRFSKSYRGVNEHLGHRLQLWHQVFQNFLRTSDEANTTGALLLELHYRSMQILLSSLYKESEMWYDGYNDEFEKMLILAERIINQDKRFNGGQSNLSIDMGVIGPLFYIGHRCRKLAFRRKALALMQSSPLREGLWHSHIMCDYVQWRINKEEALRGGIPESETLPIYARIGNDLYEMVVTGENDKMMFVQYEQGGRVIRDLLPKEWGHFRGII